MEETFSISKGITAEFLTEFKRFKLEQQTGFTVENPTEQVAILEGQAVLIMEKMNTGLVNQLLDAIGTFDGFLSQNKLTSVQGVLRSAEQQLNNVLTGQADDKTAAGALANVMALYNALSSFFKQDLPALLRSPLLKQARGAWDQGGDAKEKTPLAQVPGTEVDKIKQMFAQALNQRSTAGIGGKIEKFLHGTSLAKGISPEGVANDLVNMTFTQLDALAASAPKPAPAGAPEQLVKQAEAAEKQAAGAGTPPGGQNAAANPQQAGSASSAVVTALANSGNPYIQENAEEIVSALASLGYTITKTR